MIEKTIREGQILNGPMFNEPMKVVTVGDGGDGIWNFGLVGKRSEKFRKVTLSILISPVVDWKFIDLKIVENPQKCLKLDE